MAAEVVLRGDQVTLRPLSPADAEPLMAMFTLPEVAEVWPGDNLHEVEAQLAGTAEEVGMAVEYDGQLIGFIQYYEETDPGYRHAGIDVVIHPDSCNRGLGTDAVRTLARHLFDDVGHHRLVIDPRLSNTRAIASYRKVGFRDVGAMRLYERDNDGKWHDGLLMDMLRDDLT